MSLIVVMLWQHTFENHVKEQAMNIPCNQVEINITEPIRLIRLKEVQNRLGVSRSTIYLWIAEGTFPKPIKMGARLVAWPEHTLNLWMQERLSRAGGKNLERQEH